MLEILKKMLENIPNSETMLENVTNLNKNVSRPNTEPPRWGGARRVLADPRLRDAIASFDPGKARPSRTLGLMALYRGQ